MQIDPQPSKQNPGREVQIRHLPRVIPETPRFYQCHLRDAVEGPVERYGGWANSFGCNTKDRHLGLKSVRDQISGDGVDFYHPLWPISGRGSGFPTRGPLVDCRSTRSRGPCSAWREQLFKWVLPRWNLASSPAGPSWHRENAASLLTSPVRESTWTSVSYWSFRTDSRQRLRSKRRRDLFCIVASTDTHSSHLRLWFATTSLTSGRWKRTSSQSNKFRVDLRDRSMSGSPSSGLALVSCTRLLSLSFSCHALQWRDYFTAIK